MKILFNKYILFLFILFFSSCAISPNDETILKLVYEHSFSKNQNKINFIGVLFDMEIMKKNPSYKDYSGNKIFPVVIKTDYAQYTLTYGYTKFGPGKYDRFLEKTENWEYFFTKDERGKWKILKRELNSKESEVENWKPGSTKNEEFYKDRIKFKKENLDN
ncbi:MAG TPA: hypothetical protein DEP28_08155 [Bacteroidetes bacterium]|nr:hypothetical protein [Bacteroidota bacterium]